MKKLALYSTKTCPHCHAEKEFLKEKGIEYTNYDVGEDQEKAQEMIELSGQMGVPVTVITDDEQKDGEDKPKQSVIIGFDRGALEEALELNQAV